MKKTIVILIATLTALTLNGCRATPSVASSIAQMYDTTKTVWVKGQEVVIINSDLLDEKTLSKLESIDEKLVRVDLTKEVIVK